MEELAEFQNQNWPDLFLAKKESDKEPPKPFPWDITDCEKNNRGPRYMHYTPLNTSRAKVLEQALATEVLAIPRRAMTPPHADKTKACQFHRNRGHTTEECSALWDHIEDLVKAGHLQNFIRSTNNRKNDYYPGMGEYRRDNRDRAPPRNQSRERSRSQDRNNQRDRNQPRRVINTIAGGFAGGRSSSSAQKRHLRAIKSVNAIGWASPIRMRPITFTDQDFQGIDPVQDDPMVISIEINNWFSGERVDTRGTIDLYTYFGDDQRRRIKVRYIVVHANTSYNILLGRPSLNKLRAIVSTPHLAMKFPSEEGTIITLHADQETARECYFASLKVQPTPKPRRDVNVIGEVGQPKLIEGLELDPRMEDEDRVEPIETRIPFQLGKNEEQVTFLSSQLFEVEAKNIKQVL
ncbi:uncharacterized protein LOC109812850 [Cajanus cajan]|uniref:uncharacterized protein LOC109812850 n=1 Tax=Cajanus cajan TaxID=3821 RepID=UPI00098DC26C|nr:uncharacterized protein LOC109812850 [Cajanus cajan]